MTADYGLRKGRVCLHLLESKERNYVCRFTGHGLDYDLICVNCQGVPSTEIEVTLQSVASTKFDELEQGGFWWKGILGRPEVRIRESDLVFEHELLTLPALDDLQIVNICAVESVPDLWIGVSSDWRLVWFNFAAGSTRIGPPLSMGQIETGRTTSIQVSRNGDFAAIVNTRGRYGIVVEVATGHVTLNLDRGDYHEDVSNYSVAFVEANGGTLLIHATDWNRLDVSDARSGELLTGRLPISYKEGEDPAHDLNYFHGQLLVSPDQQLVADSGWIWHPIGVVSSWSVRDWLDTNVWESEGGLSRRGFSGRVWYWDGPMCWIDNRHLAVWGYGADDEWLVPAACIFDATTGEQVRWFAGPKGTMIFDEFLFSWDPEGMAVWDATTGERLATESGLCPVGYHPRSRRFLTVLDQARFRLSRLR